MLGFVIFMLLISVSLMILLAYLLGFRLGSESWLAEAHRVKAEAAAAERQLHDLTRSAFVAMAEEADRRRFDKR